MGGVFGEGAFWLIVFLYDGGGDSFVEYGWYLCLFGGGYGCWVGG